MSPEDAPRTPPEVLLGTGEVEFVALNDGAEISLIQGPQGGFHLLGSVRVRGIDPGDAQDRHAANNPTTEFRVWSEGSRVDLMGSRYTQGLDPSNEAGTYEMIGRVVVLDILTDDELDGRDITFEVSVSSAVDHGASATDSRTLRVVPHPNNL